MLLQTAPDPFNRIVFAVVGRIIGEYNHQIALPWELADPFDKLRPAAIAFRPIIDIEQDRVNLGKAFFVCIPEVDQYVHNKISRDFGCSKVEARLFKFRQIQAKGGNIFIAEIMVSGLDPCPVLSPAGKVAYLYSVFGIKWYPQDIRGAGGFLMRYGKLLENGIRLFYFFFGLVLATFFRLYPKARILTQIVWFEGRSSSW